MYVDFNLVDNQNQKNSTSRYIFILHKITNVVFIFCKEAIDNLNKRDIRAQLKIAPRCNFQWIRKMSADRLRLSYIRS